MFFMRVSVIFGIITAVSASSFGIKYWAGPAPHTCHDSKDIAYRGDGGRLPQIYKTLTLCPDVESLDLDLTWTGCVPPDAPWAFDFREGDKFPDLKKLSLSKYDFEGSSLRRTPGSGPGWAIHEAQVALDEALGSWSPSRLRLPPETNLQKWQRALDFSRLEQLHLAQNDDLFFTTMASNLSSLRSFSLSLRNSDASIPSSRLSFLRDLPPLQSLSIHVLAPYRAYSSNTTAPPKRTPFPLDLILAHHGPTLRSLSLSQSESSIPDLHAPMLSLSSIAALKSSAPNLQSLTLDLDRDGEWPWDVLRSIATLSNLTELSLNLEIGADLHAGDMHGGSYGFNRKGLDGKGPWREPRINGTMAEELSKWMADRKEGKRLEKVVFAVGDVKEKVYSGPLYFPPWEEGRGRGFVCKPDSGDAVTDGKEREKKGVEMGNRKGGWKCEDVKRMSFEWDEEDEEDCTIRGSMFSKELRDALAAFVAERDWAQFHTPENIAKSISIESGELLECFQWGADADPKRVKDELADVFTYCLHLADRIGVDPEQIVREKLEVTRKKISRLDFSKAAVMTWKLNDEKHGNWPVVYVLDDGRDIARGNLNNLRDIYVGESLNAAGRLRQHLETPAKQHLKNIRVIIDETLNKSACLDLESYLIKMLAGEGVNRVLNRNNGITDARYYQRDLYRMSFQNIFEQLKSEGIFTRSIPEIENSELFKLSPFKALAEDQANSVEEIVKGLLIDIARDAKSMIVIQGDPGTGKTVVAIYMIKLLVDIQTFTSLEDLDNDSRFSELFTETNKALLERLRIGLVVPQQSLRESIKKVFRKTAALDPKMVMTPFDVGEADQVFDLLLVDETHRLNQRANQSSARLNSKFSTITQELFGSNDMEKTQLDWMRAKSRHQIFLLDTAQSVRPADLPSELLSDLIADTRASGRYYQLRTQMRVLAGSDFVSYVRYILDPHPLAFPRSRQNWGEYDFRAFDNVANMRDEIFRRDAEVGLSRMVAGYAWEWKTKKDRNAFDIEIGQTRLRWNSTPTDWIASSNALEEVGSIHTVQGYDLNFVGVIIGLDLRFDVDRRRLFIDRNSYFDKKGKENNPALGRSYSDEDLLRFITQIYAVLMTRGIRGTYVYACDPGLREYLRGFIPSSASV